MARVERMARGMQQRSRFAPEYRSPIEGLASNLRGSWNLRPSNLAPNWLGDATSNAEVQDRQPSIRTDIAVSLATAMMQHEGAQIIANAFRAVES